MKKCSELEEGRKLRPEEIWENCLEAPKGFIFLSMAHDGGRHYCQTCVLATKFINVAVVALNRDLIGTATCTWVFSRVCWTPGSMPAGRAHGRAGTACFLPAGRSQCSESLRVLEDGAASRGHKLRHLGDLLVMPV